MKDWIIAKPTPAQDNATYRDSERQVNKVYFWLRKSVS